MFSVILLWITIFLFRYRSKWNPLYLRTNCDKRFSVMRLASLKQADRTVGRSFKHRTSTLIKETGRPSTFDVSFTQDVDVGRDNDEFCFNTSLHTHIVDHMKMIIPASVCIFWFILAYNCIKMPSSNFYDFGGCIKCIQVVISCAKYINFWH